MRALVLRTYGDLVIEDVPDPKPMGDETLIKVLATGICGTDVHGFTGDNGRRMPGQIMGHETVGIVVEPGNAPVHAGALVTVNPVISCGQCDACRSRREQICDSRRIIGVTPEIRSAFAELITVPSTNVVPLPDGIPPHYGALVEPLAVGHHAVARNKRALAEGVLVVGAGPIGQACILAARRAGSPVVVSERDPRRRQLAEKLGATSLDPARGGVEQQVRAHLGTLPSLAIDAVGSSTSLTDCLSATASGGSVVLVGMHEPSLDIPAYAISTHERSLMGSFVYNADDFVETANWVAQSPPELDLLIDETVDLTGAPAAFAAAAAGATGPGKILVSFNGSRGPR